MCTFDNKEVKDTLERYYTRVEVCFGRKRPLDANGVGTESQVEIFWLITIYSLDTTEFYG